VSPQLNQRTVAACVLGDHETPEHDRQGCPLIAALVRRINDLEMSDAAEDVEREVDKYRAVARVLDCALVAKLAAQDLRALVVARQISPRSDWARLLAQLTTVPA
jgi:hypothetical protein